MDVYLLTRKILKDATIGMHGHFLCTDLPKWLQMTFLRIKKYRCFVSWLIIGVSKLEKIHDR